MSFPYPSMIGPQKTSKGASALQRRFDLDEALMLADDPVTDGEAQARAALLGGVEGCEEIGQGLVVHAAARVDDVDPHHSGTFASLFGLQLVVGDEPGLDLDGAFLF